MSTTVLSVSLALFLGVLVTVLVTTLVRRSDARRGKAFPVADPVTGVLFEVRTRRWQRVLLRVIGIPIAVVGVVMTLLSVLSLFAGPDDALPVGFVIAGVCFLAFGAFLIVTASSLARTRLQVWDDRLLVRRGFQPERVVMVSDIARFTPYASQYGGIKAHAADGTKLFISDGLEFGHGDLVDYLRVRRSQQWAASFPGDVQRAQG